MADTLAELIRDPAYASMDPHERMTSFFDTAAKDALFQYSRPEVQRETARRILSGTAHHALQGLEEDTSFMDDPRFAAAGAGLTTGGIAAGAPPIAGVGMLMAGSKAARQMLKTGDVGTTLAEAADKSIMTRRAAMKGMEYANAPDFDPAARKAWDALIKDTESKYDDISKKVKFIPVDKDAPYNSAQEMFDDIKKGEMKVSTTNAEHPLWSPEQNFKFRAVHDLLGHFEGNSGFTLQGEIKALRSHLSKLKGLDPDARKALEVEVLGQAAAGIQAGKFLNQKIYVPGKDYSTFIPASAKNFLNARQGAKRQGFMDQLGEEDIQRVMDGGGSVMLSKDGKTGYIVKPDGELTNLFNYGEKGMGTKAAEHAVANGATSLKAFDPFLPEYYKQFGFKETGRAKFNPEFAPKDWNYDEHGRPDVVFMDRPHVSKELAERFKSPAMSSVGAEARVQEPAFLNKESPSYKNDLGVVGAWSLLAGNKTRKEWDEDMRRVLPSHLADADKKTLDDVYKRSGAALDKFRKVTGKDPATYMQDVLGRQILGQKAGGADWYENVMPTLEKWFGKEDAPVFAKFLAATSPLSSAAKTSEAGNVPKAIRAFLHYKQSADADEFIKRINDEDWGITGPAIRPNLARIYNGEQLSGPKVTPFHGNLSGEKPNLSTVDTQMYRGHGFASNYGGVKSENFGRKWIDAFINRSAMAQRLPNNAAAQSVDWHGIKTVEGMRADDKLEPFRKTIHNVLADDRYWPKIKQTLKLDNPPAYLDESGKTNWKMAATLSAVSAAALASGKIDPDKIREKLASFKINMPPKLFNEFVGGLKGSPSMNADENRQLEEVMRELTPSR